MLSFKTTENNLGITISGDYDDLYELHTSLSNLAGYEGQIIDYNSVSLRILGICYDIRHAYMGDREIELIDNGINEEIKKYHGKLYPNYNLHYSVNILWIEAIFSVLALEELIKIATDKKLSKKYINDEELGFWIKDEKDKKEHFRKYRIEKEIRLPYDVSIARLYQTGIWKALVEVIGINRYRRIKNATASDEYDQYNELKYKGFCTQYLDIFNMEYLYSALEKRPTLLASYINKLIKLDSEYLELEYDIKKYAKENNIMNITDIQLTNVDYPEEIQW